MKTKYELEYQLLNQHGEEYKAFTRLLLTLSVACMTILASVKDLEGIFHTVAFSLLFLSVLAGLLVQHRIMMNPLYQQHELTKKWEEAVANDDGSPIMLRRAPSKIERLFYRIQAVAFMLSFMCLAIGFISRLI